MKTQQVALGCIVVLGLALLAPFPADAEDRPPQHIARENIEWLDVWVPNSNDRDQPRVLLIGDSITRAYFPEVEQRLKGKAYLARLATSKSVGDPALLKEIELVLAETHFDVIHFNNGMHGDGYSEGEYRAAFPAFVEAIRRGAPGAKLIWATTTPVRQRDDLKQLAPKTERVRSRNAIAAEILTKRNIPTDDLFTLVEHHPEYWKSDGVHFGPDGVKAQAEQVARKIAELLPAAAVPAAAAPAPGR
jgi:hypothetical protein